MEMFLSDENLPNLCRLCLQYDDFVIDIFHRLDINIKKPPLPERIYELFQVKVDKTDNLPTNICHRCLYYTESFTEFRDNVRKCEARLQNYIASIGILGSSKIDYMRLQENEIKIEHEAFEDYCDVIPDENSLVTIVDPNQDYNSSDEDYSIDSESEYNLTTSESFKNVYINKENGINLPKAIENNGNSEACKNVFLCQFCDVAFTDKTECIKHEICHNTTNPHTCNFCSYSCSNRQSIINHIKEIHHNDRPYICVQCNKGFTRRSDLKKHTTLHTGIRPFTCTICNKNFSRNTNLTKHFRTHMLAKPFPCLKCSLSFSKPTELARHQLQHENKKNNSLKQCSAKISRKEKPFANGKCDSKIDNSGDLSSIGEGAKLKNNGPNNINTFDTENMVISLDPFSDLNRNENSDNTLKLNSNVEDFTPMNLITEKNSTVQNSSSSDFKFVCKICSKSFGRKRELERHEMIHSGIKAFPCHFCKKKFNRKDKVTRHEKIHLKDKFSCIQCNLKFKNQETLDIHLKLHTIDRLIPMAGAEDLKTKSTLVMNNEHNIPELRQPLNFYSEIVPDFFEE